MLLFNKLLRCCCRLRKHSQDALSLSLSVPLSLRIRHVRPTVPLYYACITECLLKSQLLLLATHSSSTALVRSGGTLHALKRTHNKRHKRSSKLNKSTHTHSHKVSRTHTQIAKLPLQKGNSSSFICRAKCRAETCQRATFLKFVQQSRRRCATVRLSFLLLLFYSLL